MLSVIIATRDSERPLVRTLAALVPGATSGLITRSAGRRRRLARRHAGGRGHRRLQASCRRRAARPPAASGRRMRRARRGFCSCGPGIVLDTPWIGGNAQLRRAAGARLSRRRVPARATGAVGAARSDGARCRRRRHAAAAGTRPRHRGGFLSPDRRPFRARGRSGNAIFSAASAGAALPDCPTAGIPDKYLT